MADRDRTQKQVRLVLEQQCAEVGRKIGQVIPAGTGFIFALFDFGEDGNLAYISNGQREEMARMLRDLLHRIEDEKPVEHLVPEECACCHECLAPGRDTDIALVVAFVSGLAARGVHNAAIGELLCQKHAALASEAAAFVLATSRGGRPS